MHPLAMIPATRGLAGALAIFLSLPCVWSLGGSASLPSPLVGLVPLPPSHALLQLRRSHPPPPYAHRRAAARSRRYYIDHREGRGDDAGGARAPAATPAAASVPKPSRASRMRRRKEAVRAVDTLEEFEDIVRGEREKMVVVRFHAPWCKTCRSIKVAFDRLAQANPTVKFVDTALTDTNLDLRKNVDVAAVPFGHLYHPEAGLVEETPLDRRNFSTFKKVLSSYLEGMCELPEEGMASPWGV